MSPFNRETIIERRQPQVRWSAVFAGAVISVALWMLLQVWGVGIGLSSIDPGNIHSLRSVGIGTGVWSLVSPVIAMFIGGMFGGWLAHTREKSIGAAHGFVVWAFASLAGIVTTLWTISMLAGSASPDGGSVDAHTGLQVARLAGAPVIWAGVSLLASLGAAVLGGVIGANGNEGRPQAVVRVDTMTTASSEPESGI